MRRVLKDRLRVFRIKVAQLLLGKIPYGQYLEFVGLVKFASPQNCTLHKVRFMEDTPTPPQLEDS